MFGQAGVEQCRVLDGVGTHKQPYTWRPGTIILASSFFIDISNNHYDQVGAIMLANLAILADVIRVLRTKLRTDQNQVRTIMMMMRLMMVKDDDIKGR